MAAHSFTSKFRSEGLLHIIIALTLLSGDTSTVRSLLIERCHVSRNGPLCTHLCPPGPFAGKTVKIINPTAAICGSSNTEILQPESRKKTFTWRRFDAGREIKNDCGSRCMRSRAGNGRVRRVKEIGQKETTDSTNLLCLPTKDVLIYKRSEQCQNHNETSDVETDRDNCDSSIWTATCSEVGGVCPAMTALSCLARMQPKSTLGNVEALNDRNYADSSVKITIARRDDKVELTEKQKGMLSDFAAHGIQLEKVKRPMVVQIEDTALNKTTKYVIVDRKGDVMIGVPYEGLQETIAAAAAVHNPDVTSRSATTATTTPRPTATLNEGVAGPATTHPTTTTTSRPTKPKPADPSRPQWTSSTITRPARPKGTPQRGGKNSQELEQRNSFTFTEHPEPLVRRQQYPSEPAQLPPLFGCLRPQRRIIEQLNFADQTTELPTTRSNWFGSNETPTEGSYYSYNQHNRAGRWTGTTLQDEDSGTYQDYEDLDREATYVLDWPQSHWLTGDQPLTTIDAPTNVWETTRNSGETNVGFPTSNCCNDRRYPLPSLAFPEILTAPKYHTPNTERDRQILGGDLDGIKPNTNSHDSHTNPPNERLCQEQDVHNGRSCSKRTHKGSSIERILPEKGRQTSDPFDPESTTPYHQIENELTIKIPELIARKRNSANERRITQQQPGNFETNMPMPYYLDPIRRLRQGPTVDY